MGKVDWICSPTTSRPKLVHGLDARIEAGEIAMIVEMRTAVVGAELNAQRAYGTNPISR